MVAGRSEIQHLSHDNFLVTSEKGKWGCIDYTKQSHEALLDIHAHLSIDIAQKRVAICRWTSDMSLD